MPPGHARRGHVIGDDGSAYEGFIHDGSPVPPLDPAAAAAAWAAALVPRPA